MNRYRKDFAVDLPGWSYLYLHYPLFLASIHQNSQNPIFSQISRFLLALGKDKKLFNYSKALKGETHSIPVSFDQEGLANFKEIFLAREYAVDRIPPNISTLVDAGANRGLASLYFALNYPLTKMLLIEANPTLIAEIRENVQNNFPKMNVEIFNRCLSAQKDQFLKFYIAENSRDSSMTRVSAKQQEVEVPAMSLQEVVSHFDGDIDLLKIDIEGAEHELISQEPSAFLKFKNIIAEVHGDRSLCDRFEEALQKLGFDVSRMADSVAVYNCEVIFAKRQN